MTHNLADTMAMRALILAVQAEGGRLEVPDHGQPIFQDLQVTWAPGSITLSLGPLAASSQIELPLAGAILQVDHDIPQQLCDDCPPVGAIVPTRCSKCPRR